MKAIVAISVFAFFAIIALLNKNFSAFDRFLDWGFAVFDVWRTVAFLVSLVFLVLIVYTLIRLHLFLSKVRREEPTFEPFSSDRVSRSVRAKRWDDVIQHLNSQNPSDWKLAIMEADNIMDDLFAKMGYPGNSLGERLKNVERSNFQSLDEVWRAHKFRNQLVHEGAVKKLSRKQAEKAISFFEKGLKELGYL